MHGDRLIIMCNQCSQSEAKNACGINLGFTRSQPTSKQSCYGTHPIIFSHTGNVLKLTILILHAPTHTLGIAACGITQVSAEPH